MASSAADKVFSDPVLADSQSSVKESEALMARVNSTMARFQQALDAKNVESKQKQKQKPSVCVSRHVSQEEDAEKAFNAVAESAGTGLGIGAKPGDKEKDSSKAADQPLRKKLLSGQTKDSNSTSRPKIEKHDEDQESVGSKAQKKRKRKAFLDELLAERSGKKR